MLFLCYWWYASLNRQQFLSQSVETLHNPFALILPQRARTLYIMPNLPFIDA